MNQQGVGVCSTFPFVDSLVANCFLTLYVSDNWFEDRVSSVNSVNQSKPVKKDELSLMFSACSSQPERLEHLNRHEWPDSRRTLPILSNEADHFTSTYKATSAETIEQKKSLRKDSGKKFLVNRLVRFSLSILLPPPSTCLYCTGTIPFY